VIIAGDQTSIDQIASQALSSRLTHFLADVSRATGFTTEIIMAEEGASTRIIAWNGKLHNGIRSHVNKPCIISSIVLPFVV
jgi:hypothetical protein